VLITSSVVGPPVRIAIECKNEAEKIGSPKIDAFVGKLKDVGIPSSLGIYVSVNGYTGSAIERARKAGIRTLVLTGLTKDRLAAAVTRAFQSMVYLFADIAQLQVENEVSTVEEFAELSSFYDANGVLRDTLPHMVWRAWGGDRCPPLWVSMSSAVCGFFFAVSGSTIPPASCSSCSTILSRARSPNGLSFISRSPS